jgi:hypothetical protein
LEKFSDYVEVVKSNSEVEGGLVMAVGGKQFIDCQQSKTVQVAIANGAEGTPIAAVH